MIKEKKIPIVPLQVPHQMVTNPSLNYTAQCINTSRAQSSHTLPV